MDGEQKDRLIEFIHLMADGITDELILKIPGLTNGNNNVHAQPPPIHPGDPRFPYAPNAKQAQVYEVTREDDRGQEYVEATTVPQLLAEMNDTLLTLMETMEKGKRRRKS